MLYENNDQLKRLIKGYATINGMTLKDIAGKMHIFPQTLQNIFKKKNLSFEDVQQIADTFGYCLTIDLVPKENSKQ